MANEQKQVIDDAYLIGAIRKEVLHYRSSHSDFCDIVSQIGSYVSNIGQDHIEIKEGLLTKWRVLEEVNALSLDEGSAVPLSEYSDLLDSTFSEILEITDKA